MQALARTPHFLPTGALFRFPSRAREGRELNTFNRRDPRRVSEDRRRVSIEWALQDLNL